MASIFIALPHYDWLCHHGAAASLTNEEMKIKLGAKPAH